MHTCRSRTHTPAKLNEVETLCVILACIRRFGSIGMCIILNTTTTKTVKLFLFSHFAFRSFEYSRLWMCVLAVRMYIIRCLLLFYIRSVRNSLAFAVSDRITHTQHTHTHTFLATSILIHDSALSRSVTTLYRLCRTRRLAILYTYWKYFVIPNTAAAITSAKIIRSVVSLLNGALCCDRSVLYILSRAL